MVVLGIDPGIATVGFGAIEAKKGRCQVLRYGVISTPAGLTLSNRLSMIFRDMEELIHTFQPDEMAVEELFFHTNLTTGIAVAHGRGVILLAAEQLGCRFLNTRRCRSSWPSPVMGRRIKNR